MNERMDAKPYRSLSSDRLGDQALGPPQPEAASTVSKYPTRFLVFSTISGGKQDAHQLGTQLIERGLIL